MEISDERRKAISRDREQFFIKLLEMPADQLKAVSLNSENILRVLAENAAADLALQGFRLSSVERLDYDISTSRLTATINVFKDPMTN